jgi:hypothetical protein
MVNLNCVAISVALALSEQLFSNWHTMLMPIIMPHIQLSEGA